MNLIGSKSSNFELTDNSILECNSVVRMDLDL